jgi:hypothetical protein
MRKCMCAAVALGMPHLTQPEGQRAHAHLPKSMLNLLLHLPCTFRGSTATAPQFEMWSMYKAFRMYSIRLLPAAPSSGSRRSSSSGSRRPRVRAADPAAATAAAAAEEAELAELTVELGPAASRSSSSSTSTEAEVSAAGVGDSLEDLIGFIVRRNPNGGRQQPNPSPPRAPLAPKDLHPRCVPVTAKKPPPGWSYYYDSLMRRGDKPLLHLEGVAAVSADSEENVLGTCTGDEF